MVQKFDIIEASGLMSGACISFQVLKTAKNCQRWFSWQHCHQILEKVFVVKFFQWDIHLVKIW